MKMDTKFFTNEADDKLLDRFRSALVHSRCFDALVGYFRASGFAPLAEALKDVERIRILVGINAGREIVEAATGADSLLQPSMPSHAAVHSEYSLAVQQELETAPETQATEDAISQFVRYLNEGRMEIRGHPGRNIHAKVYILHYRENQATSGCVITGSSNFTRSGLTARREFNVELRDPGDVAFASDRFEKLWAEAVELTEEFKNTLHHKTWYNNEITPYELYLKFLYEYFKEDINIDEIDPAMLPEGFRKLEYQQQAVIAARKILDAHGGVFLADVVGLGKTYIASMLLQGLPGRKLIICPPILKPYWEEALRTFYVHPFMVVSSGKLSDTVNSAKYQYVVVDESHRYRNEKTQSYELLKKICLGKKVILLSATPFNNRLDDLLAQIKLFQKGKASTIPGIPNLETFFRKQASILKNLDPKDQAGKAAAEKVASIIRDKVLKHVMIRRTRKEVTKYFSDDMAKNGLSFPVVENPKPLIYQFDPVLDSAFNQTINILISITFARYTPLLYLKTGASQIETLSQNNIRGFIKSLLVKRLESSFHAFSLTVERIIYSYEAFMEALRQGKIYIGRQIDICCLLDCEDIDEVENIISKKDVDVYNVNEFDKQLLTDLQNDLASFFEIAKIWANIYGDPKYDAFLENLTANEILKEERVLVFTESKETAEYLYWNLEKKLPGQAMMFSSQSAFHNGAAKSASDARDFIRRNFDPSHEEPGDDFRILITTDALAEGMNLHRAGRIINYDLPWNPTRVMQRLGRVNRVGTTHDRLYIFNFFPTSQADKHLGLKDNISRKITAFNAVLGNDNKILFEEENPDPHGLFRRLTSMVEEEDEDSELEYLQTIRQVRDNAPKIFEKIKRLPLKARSAYANPQQPDELLIFFREGHLKKFVACGTATRELTFLEAAPLLRAAPEARRAKLPADYYDRLQNARRFLDGEVEAEMTAPRISTRNKHLLETISYLQTLSALTDDEQEYIALLYKAVAQSALAQKSIKRLADVCKRPHASPLALLNALRAAMPPKDLQGLQAEEQEVPKASRKPKQIVLVQYLAPVKGETA